MDPNENRKSYDPDQWLGGNEPDDDQGVDAHPAHKKFFVISVVTVVLVVLAVVIAVLLTWPGIEEEAPPPDTSTRIIRPGYGNVPDRIADPAALVHGTSENTVSYQPDTIIDACNLLPPETIRQNDPLIAPDVEPGVMSRHFFDGSSEAVVERWEQSPALVQELNDCSYGLVNKKGQNIGNLYLSVYQPAYAGGAAIRAALDDYLQRGEQIASVDIYDRTTNYIESPRTFYFLAKDQVYANLEINLGMETESNTRDKILRDVAKRLAAAIESPDGPATFSYKSPTFSGKYVSACAISNAEDIQAVFRTSASPSLQERIATAVGVTERGVRPSNFIANQCIRRTTDERASASKLTITTRSFENELIAQDYLKSQRKDATIDPAEENIVGDDMFFNPGNGPGSGLFFRIDAAFISLTAFEQQAENIDQEDRLERLRMVAADIVERMNAEEEPEEAPGEETSESKENENNTQNEPAGQTN